MTVLCEYRYVTDALEDLGLTQDIIIQAIKYGESARNNATPHHPPSWAGMSAWAEATKRLRDLSKPLGWQKDDTKNFSTTVSPDKRHAIAVMSGDIYTGNPDRTPQPRYTKGAAAVEAVELSQLLLFPGEKILSKISGPKMWFLLVNRQGDIINFELSNPESMATDGKVATWKTRIILPSFHVDPTPSIENRPIYSEKVEIAVTRLG